MVGRPMVTDEAVLALAMAAGRPQLVNTVKAAEIAGVTVRTIYNWVRDNRVVFYRTPGRGVRIVVASLLRAAR